MFMKKTAAVSLFFVVCFFVKVTFAQEAVKDTSYWKKASQFGLNLSQGAFSGSWQGGGSII